jgi:cation diffusion facilitator family transporter
MAIHDLSSYQHNHAFDSGNTAGERRTWIVVGITAVTMVVEIVAGWLTGSMALLADGWHMGTHVVALSIAGLSYLLARRWAQDERFAFGTWKIEVLGAFTSALLLGVVALAMIWESAHRLVAPEQINFVPALIVAVAGLVINLLSALVLHDGGQGHHGEHQHAAHDHDHDHGHGHDHDHGHGHAPHAQAQPGGAHHDLNLRSAYVHVLADAFTSVLAIVALSAGLWAGWTWLDPVMGIVGALVIAVWSKGLLRDSARVLLDREMDSPIVGQIRGAIQSDGDAEICDLHVWRVGRAAYAAVVTVVADRPRTPAEYRARVAGIASLVHVSVEVNRCPDGDCP